MKVSNREVKLFKVMAFVLIAVLYVNYLMLPGIAHYEVVKNQRHKTEKRYNDVVNFVATEDGLDKQIYGLAVKTNDYLEKYFTTTEQEELVLLLDEFLKEGLDVDKIEYSEYSSIPVGERRLKQLTAVVRYSGTYDEMLGFLRTNWSFYKQIGVDGIEVKRRADGTITGNIVLHYYWAPKSTEYDDQLFHWVQNEAYNRRNPFESIVNIDRTNYIYIGGDTSKFEEMFDKPFADVTGHWAESEIESFRQSGYVIADGQNRFLPDEPITRGEFIIMLDQIYEWPVPEERIDLSAFTDFAELGHYEGAIAKAIIKGYTAGYVIGYTDRTIRPKDPISYDEVEVIMSKIKNEENFSWDNIGKRILDNRSVTSPGLDNKTLNVSRAEAVYLLYFYK